MKVGLIMFPTDLAITPAELAVAAEERGFESVFFTEHTHIPVSRETPFPPGGELPEECRRTMDPFISLAMAAQATTDLLLGTGVCLVAQREPIVTGKAVATLDRLSGGRLLFGVGAGWNREEMRSHGLDPRHRMAVLEDRVRAMKEIWTQDEASYRGPYVGFDPMWCWPKPLSSPHPPVIIGGTGPTVLERVVRFGDGWMPNRLGGPEELAPRLRELDQLRLAVGRDRIPTTVVGIPRKVDVLDSYRKLGVERCLLIVPPRGRDSVLAKLDRDVDLVAELNAS